MHITWIVLLAWSASCAPDAAPDAAEVRARQRIEELIVALTPIEETVTSDKRDAHFVRGVTLVEELKAAGPDVGRAALAALRDRKEKVIPVERGLITVAAHAATSDSLPFLERLVTEYGAALDLRTEATLALAEVAPERALLVLEPMVTGKKRATMPPTEFLVKAWVNACDKTGRSPVPELVQVAMGFHQDGYARVLAVKELARHPDPRGEQALRAILVESTGDGYLRRMAAQGIRDMLPRETACSIFREAADHEADLNMLRFLADMLEKNCGP